MGGFYDGKIVISYVEEKDKWYELIQFNDDFPILSLFVDRDEEYLFLGNSIGNVAVYRIDPDLKKWKLTKYLIDQKSAISHLHCNSDLDLWVSTSIDGNINLYTLPLCKQARTIKIGKKCSYSFLTSSPLPCIVVICDETDNSEIIVYSLNGKLITNKELYFKLSNPIIIKNLNGIEYLAYIGKEGISIHYLPTLELLFNKDIGQNIHTIFTSEDKKCLYCVNRNGNDIYLIREEIKKNIRNASMALMNSL
jgi:WD40 repeat protein